MTKTLIVGLGAALAAAVALCAQPALRDLAEKRGIRLGTAVNSRALANDAAYRDTLAREFNQVEPENAAKFGLVHPQRDTFRFAPIDALVDFAERNRMAVRGHTLLWHKQNPEWLAKGGFPPLELRDILRQHIAAVVGRYAGRIYAWDVVNEAFNDDGSLRPTIWHDSPGIGMKAAAYIEQALRWARAADPKALLFYNDYNAEGMNAKSDAIYQMARDFRERGVPLDGIGLQMHLTLARQTLDGVEANMKRLAALGLQIQITELDVRLPVDAGLAAGSDLAAQARIYGDVVALCLKFAACTAVQSWGFTDKYSWIPGKYRGMGAALEFDAGYRPKAAYGAVVQALQGK